MFDLLPVETFTGSLNEFRRVLRLGDLLVLTNMTGGERPGSQVTNEFTSAPAQISGCRDIMLAGSLAQACYIAAVRAYHQQMLFPSEVVLEKPIPPVS